MEPTPIVNILLVDDNPAKLLALESVLAALGQHLVTARSGEEALQFLLRQDFAVIVLDVYMPGMDGFETAALIREHPRTAQTPIIFVSAINPADTHAAKGYTLGAVDYIFTPTPEVLRAKVGVFVALAQQTALVRRQADLLRQAEEHEYQQRLAEVTARMAELEQRVAERTAELQCANEELQRANEELQRANEELQQFAYVASHDLQEPLRMVTSYMQLLSQRAHGQLDAEAQEFMGFAVEGAQRMKGLIDDLLLYSRLGSRGMAATPTDSEAVLQQTLQNLRMQIADSGATVTADSLPIVHAERAQLAVLWQNLLSNALKFRGPEPPRIHVSAQRQGAEWVFAVRDNGIGLEPQHAERIFQMFQRLHTRREYPGNGVGLALCKKIVERDGGRIWVESEPGQGATFFFTLPAA